MDMEENEIIYIDEEKTETLIDGEYYWIAYQFPKSDDEIWGIGVYNKKFNQFDLCNRVIITPEYIIETHMVEHPI